MDSVQKGIGREIGQPRWGIVTGAAGRKAAGNSKFQAPSSKEIPNLKPQIPRKSQNSNSNERDK
jgi:hypothetical protein